jgi:pyruvate kinase
MKPAVDSHARFSALLAQVVALRHTVIDEAVPILTQLSAEIGRSDPAMANLADYLALRHHDVRPLQRQLMPIGLSSLGRLESRVVPTLDAVTVALAALSGAPHPAKTLAKTLANETFFAGETRLVAATDRLFGPAQPSRRCRIMVTLTTEAAIDAEFVIDLARAGMDVARINCAHDDSSVWAAMADQVRAAGKLVGRNIKVLMDIAGPKIRVDAVKPKRTAKLYAGDLFRLVDGDFLRKSKDQVPSTRASLPEMVAQLKPADRLLYDDGKLEGVVEGVAAGVATIRVTRAPAGGIRLKPEKGINLPDTALGLSPLTPKDEVDLATVIQCADIIGYSFVSCAEDIDALETALARHGLNDRPLSLIAKIEQPEAVKNLPSLIARAVRNRPFGVMIARGDLAAQIGFERLAEMQEEILWICEAAAVPAIWATQVLESFVRDGVPSRGEMTDAAMAARAECVMLNKGPGVVSAVAMLDRLLVRMDADQFKKTPTLRALKSW